MVYKELIFCVQNQDKENLKRVAWGLDVGHEDRTRIKSLVFVFAYFLRIIFFLAIFYLMLFIFVLVFVLTLFIDPTLGIRARHTLPTPYIQGWKRSFLYHNSKRTFYTALTII